MPLFRSEIQVRILAALLMRPSHEWTAAALARELGKGQSSLHPDLRRLEDTGLITARNVGRSRVLSANSDHPVARPLLEILRYLYGPEVVIAKEFAGIEQLFIFGSWATRHSGDSGPPPRDVDVLVIGQAERGDVYEAADRAQERVGMPVNPVLASPRRWESASDALIRDI